MCECLLLLLGFFFSPALEHCILHRGGALCACAFIWFSYVDQFNYLFVRTGQTNRIVRTPDISFTAFSFQISNAFNAFRRAKILSFLFARAKKKKYKKCTNRRNERFSIYCSTIWIGNLLATFSPVETPKSKSMRKFCGGLLICNGQIGGKRPIDAETVRKCFGIRWKIDKCLVFFRPDDFLSTINNNIDGNSAEEKKQQQQNVTYFQ